MIVWSTESNSLSEIVKKPTTSDITIKNLLTSVWTECLQRHEVSIVREGDCDFDDLLGQSNRSSQKRKIHNVFIRHWHWCVVPWGSLFLYWEFDCWSSGLNAQPSTKLLLRSLSVLSYLYLVEIWIWRNDLKPVKVDVCDIQADHIHRVWSIMRRELGQILVSRQTHSCQGDHGVKGPWGDISYQVVLKLIYFTQSFKAGLFQIL